MQEVTLVKAGGPLGLSIVGGSDHASHPFGVNEPGVFISKVLGNIIYPYAHAYQKVCYSVHLTLVFLLPLNTGN